MKTFDYAVIGCGVLGSSALYWLSRRAGERVIAFEQFCDSLIMSRVLT